MSEYYNVFISYPGKIEDIDKVIRQICYKSPLEEYDADFGKRYFYQIMGTEITLVSAGNDFEDIGDMEFSKYDYYIDVRVYSIFYENPEYNGFCRAMAKFFGAELAHVLKIRTLVSHEMEEEVARFDYSS